MSDPVRESFGPAVHTEPLPDTGRAPSDQTYTVVKLESRGPLPGPVKLIIETERLDIDEDSPTEDAWIDTPATLGQPLRRAWERRPPGYPERVEADDG